MTQLAGWLAGWRMQDGSYCLVWGGTHQHSWMKPANLKGFDVASSDYSALSKPNKSGLAVAVEEARSGRLKDYERIKTGEKPRIKTREEPGGEKKAWYWAEEEERALLRMVNEEGGGDWASKAERLGTGRTEKSVKGRWTETIQPRLRAEGSYRYVPARNAPTVDYPPAKGDKRARGEGGIDAGAPSAAKRARSTASKRTARAPLSSSDGSGGHLKSNKRIKAEPNGDGAANGRAKAWGDEESRRLLAIVKKHGVGDWSVKAAELGSNRTARSVQDYFYSEYGHPAGGCGTSSR